MEANIMTTDEFIEDAGNALMWLWRREHSDQVTLVSKETGAQYTIISVSPVWPKEQE